MKKNGSTKIFNNTSIKVRMMTTFLMVIILLFAINIFSVYKSYSYNQKYKLLVDNTVKEGRLKEILKEMVQITGNILVSNDQKDLDSTIESEESIASYNILKNLIINTKIDCNNAIIFNSKSETAMKASDSYNSAEKKVQYVETVNGELLSKEVNYMKIVQEEIDKSFRNNLIGSMLFF